MEIKYYAKNKNTTLYNAKSSKFMKIIDFLLWFD